MSVIPSVNNNIVDILDLTQDDINIIKSVEKNDIKLINIEDNRDTKLNINDIKYDINSNNNNNTSSCTFDIENLNRGMRWYTGQSFFLNKMENKNRIYNNYNSYEGNSFNASKNAENSLELVDIFGGYRGNNRIVKALLTTFPISEINSNGHRLLNVDPIIDSFFQDTQDVLIVGQDFFQKECANKNLSPSVRKLQPRKTYHKLHFVFPYMNPKVRGCMHPKIWLLFFIDRLRVVISSANMDMNEICFRNEVFWIQDFPLRSSFHFSSHELNTPYEFRKFKTNAFDTSYEDINHLMMSEQYGIMQANSNQFMRGLTSFIGHLLVDFPEFHHYISSILQYNLTFSNAYFVSSVPGIHSSIPYPQPFPDFETDLVNWVKTSKSNYNDSVNSLNLNCPSNKHQSSIIDDSNSFLCTFSTNIVVDETQINNVFEKLSNLLGSKKRKNDLMSRRLWIKVLDGKLKVFLERNCLGSLGFDCKFLLPLISANIIDISHCILYHISNTSLPLVDIIIHKGQLYKLSFYKKWHTSILIAMRNLLMRSRVGTGIVELESILRHSGAFGFDAKDEIQFSAFSSSLGNMNTNWFSWIDTAVGRERDYQNIESAKVYSNEVLSSISQPMSIIYNSLEEALLSASNMPINYKEMTKDKNLKDLCKRHDQITNFKKPRFAKQNRSSESHAKIMLRLFKSLDSWYGWVYLGSHNTGVQAWGTSDAELLAGNEVRQKQIQSLLGPDIAPDTCLKKRKLETDSPADFSIRINNYEAGVTLICPSNEFIGNAASYLNLFEFDEPEPEVKPQNLVQMFPFPFEVPSCDYNVYDVPFTRKALNELLKSDILPLEVYSSDDD